MPPKLKGTHQKYDLHALREKVGKNTYKYPYDLDLSPGSQFHDKIRDRVLEMVFESHNIMSQRYNSWNEIDRTMTAYILASDAEKKVQERDNRRPISIVLPIQYATLQILLTYMITALGEDPMLRVDGYAPEDVPKAVLMQHHINRQALRTKMLLAIHTILGDAYRYGFGGGLLEWYVKPFRTIRDGKDIRSELTSPNTSPSSLSNILYEGNKLIPFDPYKYYPDTSLSIQNHQESEFESMAYRTSLGYLMGMEVANPKDYFNVKYLEYIDATSQLSTEAPSARGDKTGLDVDNSDNIYTKPVDVIPVYIDLVPSEWELGNGKEIETWLFKIAGDEIIIDAGPTNLRHGMKPTVIASPDDDGHSISPMSRLEVGYGMQHTINWLHNARIANIRKSINNILIVDPGLANYNDVVDTREGAVVRMRRAVWGLGKIADAVTQIPVADVTQNFVSDMQVLIQISQMVSGAQDAVSGTISSKKERVSSAETRLAARSAFSRLEKDARIVWSQFTQDLVEMMISNTIQFMSDEAWVALSGRWPENIMEEFNIKNDRALMKRDDFQNFQYDLIAHDGTITGAHDDPQSLTQFFQVLMSSQNAQVLNAVDFMGMMLSIARRLGVKEAYNWIRRTPVQTTTASPEAIQNQVQQGNLVPANGQ